MPAGACMVAEAAERAGHSVTLLDLMFEQDPLRAVEAACRKAYEAVGFSVRNIDNNSMQDPAYYIDDLASLVRAARMRTDAPVVLGGAALGVMPEAILRATGASCAVIGGGEAVFPSLLERLSRQISFDNLEGLALIRDGEFRKNSVSPDFFLKSCASPDYARWIDLRGYRSRLATVPLRTKLGCGFQCVYCTYRAIEGETQHLRDPESVTEAVARLVSSGARDFEFTDSVFNAPHQHAMAVCEALARRGLPARFQSMDVNPLYLDDELLSAMERAGFSGIGMTVESASDPVLRGLRKGFTARHVHAAAETVRRHRLPCLWIFMLGGPGETEATVRETLRFAETAVRPGDAAFFTVGIRIYPGTELEAIARKQGVLFRERGEMLMPVFYLSPDVHANWIIHQVNNSLSANMNFLCAESLSVPYLPQLNRLAHRFGLATPLWRHTGRIRKGLRFIGMDA